MDKSQIKNLRFELVNSTVKGYKEIDVIFDYNGEDHKYFIFIEEGKNVNYINEAKKQFERDLKLGKVDKSFKKTSASKPYLIVGAALGAVALTFVGLFIWKTVASSHIEETPTEYLELPSKIIRTINTITNSYEMNIEIETNQVIKNKKIASAEYTQTQITKGSSSYTVTTNGVTNYNDRGEELFGIYVTEQKGEGRTSEGATHYEYKYNDSGLITWEREVQRNRMRPFNPTMVINERHFKYDRLNRLTEEIHYIKRESDLEPKKIYEDKRTYKNNFETFVTRDLDDKETREATGIEEITHIENVLDDKGYVTNSYQKVTVGDNNTETWTYNTYDENHCLIYEEIYKNSEKIKDNLVGERYNTYDKNNPKKLVSYYCWNSAKSEAVPNIIMTTYVFASRHFDKYDRTTDIVTKQMVVSTSEDGTTYETMKGENTTHNEYNQLIPA